MSLTMAESTRLEELQRRVQRDPASISFAALAEEYRRLGLFQEAIDTCRAGLQRHPSYPSARVTLGRALLEIGEYDAASTELEQVLKVAPENLAAIRGLAEIHRRRGEMPESIEHYAEAVASEEAAAAPAPVEPVAPVAVASLEPVARPELVVTPELVVSTDPVAPLEPVASPQFVSTPEPVSPPEFVAQSAPPALSPNVPIAVSSSVVDTYEEPPSLAGLEQFLAAIQRARREAIFQTAR